MLHAFFAVGNAHAEYQLAMRLNRDSYMVGEPVRVGISAVIPESEVKANNDGMVKCSWAVLYRPRGQQRFFAMGIWNPLLPRWTKGPPWACPFKTDTWMG